MSWKINEKEAQSVISLPAESRYTYFVKRVADWAEVWSLAGDDGWVLAGDDEGHEVVPVWPHSTYAQQCAKDQWAGSQPKAIDLNAWLEKWTPGMERDGRLIAVFPTPENNGIVVDPSRLKMDLEEERQEME
jgi:hypothetical protein